MDMEFSFVLLTRMLAVKKLRKLYDDIFFYIEGGHLLNVNQLV
jgi:hypothetical protein